MTSTWLQRAALVAIAASLAACSGGGGRPAVAPAPARPVGGTVESAFEALMQGNQGEARKQLKAVLKRDPRDAEAQMLLQSMDGDAREQLGPQNYNYTVRTGDTISGLAQRFLGNRLKGYQLARYNDLKTPVTLAPGQTLRIPGTPPRPPEPVRRPDPTPTPPRPAPSAPAPTPAKPKSPAAPVANPAAARQARAAGLAALNQGKVAQAVIMLRRAAALDPGNALIARDLGRAERIAATVRAKR